MVVVFCHDLGIGDSYTISFHKQIYDIQIFHNILIHKYQEINRYSFTHLQYSVSLGFWTLSIVKYSKIYKQYFGNWICFHPQVRREEFLKCVFYILEYQIMEKFQTPSDSECYTPLSEPFKIYRMLNRAQIVFCHESKKAKSNVLGQWKNTITFQQLMNLDVSAQPDARHNYYVPGSSSSSKCSNGSRK
jgi:hypothetical protein